MTDLTVSEGPVTLRVTGLRSTLRAMSAAGADAEDMKDLMSEIGSIVVRAAVPLTRRDTGTLAGTIRAGRGKTKSVVRMGGARARYAGPMHYGWPARHIAPRPSLVLALQGHAGQILTRLDEGLAQLLDEHDLT